MAGMVLGYACTLGILGLLARSLAPSPPPLVVIAALAGSALCALWGLAAFAGYRSRAGVIVTLIPVALVLLHQSVNAWWPGPAQVPLPATLAASLTATWALTVSLLVYLFHGGNPPGTSDSQARTRTGGSGVSSCGEAGDMASSPRWGLPRDTI